VRGSYGWAQWWTKRGPSDGDGIGKSEMEELVPEWGWQRDKGSWFQRQGEAYQKGRQLFLYSMM